ncbi:MAG: putative eukaryotic translation initiation factor 2-alpha kinase 1 [Solumvirus sp.]|uniref:Putative eukaryotic translation initiation factor 2-alpha kinase 1 n=1 Tax=Solumvirus sp. TaxID=2487773 RepID=A0A3G5AID6_9VIRU|nr:MAG: putative eukaryotic translation initiation factor 2-alpha kinase 1 [Solumvirus sp.]
MKNLVLGKGAYGSVVARDGYAYKKFEKADHLIQEFSAGSYLRNVGAKNIVVVHEANHKTLELKMDQYDMNLRKFFESNPDHAKKMSVFHDILWGLCEIHSRDLVHGDIKPGNILVKISKNGEPSAYIGDLGFVSLAPYSKVRRTTQVYRDEKMMQHHSHDLYSLGIVMLELFGNIKVMDKLTHDEVIEYCGEKIKNRKFSEAIIALTADNYKERPDCDKLLKDFFKIEFKVPKRDAPDCKHGLSEKTVSKFTDWLKPLCREYKIKRGKHGLAGLLIYIAKYTEATKGHFKLHAGVMVMILSSLFGKSKFQEHELQKWCKKKYSHEQVLAATASLLACDEVIRLLMLRKKS